MKRLSSVFAAAVVAFSSLLSVAIIPAASAAVQNCTWTGATDLKFNTATNWSGCGAGVPQAGDNLIFDNTSLSASATLDNDITGLSVNDITFQGSNSGGFAFYLTGNAITLTGNITANSTSSANISNNLVLSGNPILSGGYITLSGAISGTGNITSNTWTMLGDTSASTFTGSITQNAGSLILSSETAAGAAANIVTINTGADLTIGNCSATTFSFANPLHLNGASSDAVNKGKLTTGDVCTGGGGAAENYGAFDPINQDYTLSGVITLGSDITFMALAKTTTLTGVLVGAHSINLMDLYSGSLIINSSNNGSSSANGTVVTAPVTKTLSDSMPGATVDIHRAVVTIDGSRSDTTVFSGGKLMGSGTVGILTVDTGGTVAPGHSPGCLTSGAFTLSGTYEAELGGTTACTDYDQMKVTGTVTLTGGTLNTVLYNSYKPAKGTTYTIIDNDGSDAVTGTFTGLAEGATFTVDGYVFAVSYTGGDGNDVVLTVQNVPATPDTGFAMIAAHPGATLAITVALAGSIFAIAKHNSRKVAVRTRR